MGYVSFDENGIRFKQYQAKYHIGAPKMISEQRRYFEACEHPKATHMHSEITDSAEIICPYCGDEREPWDIADNDIYQADDEEVLCLSCDKRFLVSARFGSGFTSKPTPCRQHHYVFLQQYFYNSKTWRIFGCLHCGELDYFTNPNSKYDHNVKDFVIEGDPARTLLPWLPEFDDPDYFDPEGILKPTEPVDLSEPSYTPILDFLNDVDYWTKQPNWRHMRSRIGKVLDKYAPKINQCHLAA